MLVQSAALGLLALSDGALAIAAVGAVALGAGTALVYPTLIAAMSDAVAPVERAPIVGIYRFWRDTGYVFGGLIAGAVADALGYGGAIACVAGLTAASGLWALFDMPSAGGSTPGGRVPARPARLPASRLSEPDRTRA
jgi:MFS family permease